MTRTDNRVPGQSEMDALLHARRVFLAFFQAVFGCRPSGAYRWSPTSSESEIHITSELPINPETFHAQPALIVARGGMAYRHLGLNDFDSRDPQTGTVTKTALIEGTITLIVLSRVLLESERLAVFCSSEVLARREELQKSGRFFDIGQNQGISAPSQAGSIVAGDRGDGFVATSVSFPFYLPWVSKITPLNLPIFEGVDMAVTKSGSASPSPAGMPYPPGKAPPANYPVFVFPSTPFRQPLPSPSEDVAPSSSPTVIRFGV